MHGKYFRKKAVSENLFRILTREEKEEKCLIGYTAKENNQDKLQKSDCLAPQCYAGKLKCMRINPRILKVVIITGEYGT